MSFVLNHESIFTNMEASLPYGAANLCKSNTCCFTGHRTEKLPGGGNPQSPEFHALRSKTKDAIAMAIVCGATNFIIGMARGFDLLAADILLTDFADFKIKIICAVPYASQYKELRTDNERYIYRKTLDCAHKIVCFSQNYQTDCYKVRNQFMVNYSGQIIGYLKTQNEFRSGTVQTINMAKKAGLNMHIIYGSIDIGNL